MPYFYFENKKIYYKETGCGEPFVLLHGDTASGRMFEPLLPLYEDHFRMILIDFLGIRRALIIFRMENNRCFFCFIGKNEDRKYKNF